MSELRNLLEFTCLWVEREAPKLAAGRDLDPMLVLVREDGEAEVGLAQWGSTEEREAAIGWFRARLHAERAAMYAIVSAAWMVKVGLEHAEAAEAEVAAHGTGRHFRDQRREVYQITVGNRAHCLMVAIAVERDWKGKIRKLRRGPIVDSADGAASGRMVNLLQTVN